MALNDVSGAKYAIVSYIYLTYVDSAYGRTASETLRKDAARPTAHRGQTDRQNLYPSAPVSEAFLRVSRSSY